MAHNLKKEDFITLYEPIHDQFYRFCRTLTGNVHQTEDLINNTLLVAFEQFEQITKPESFKYYLFRIASNQLKMEKRRNKFHAEFSKDEHAFLIDKSQNPEISTDYQILLQKMNELPDKISEALILFYVSDLSLLDIQKIQGGTLSAIKQRIKRGREKLLKSLTSETQVHLAMMLFTL